MIKVYIVNSVMYTEYWTTLGEWVEFPTPKEKIEMAFESIGVKCGDCYGYLIKECESPICGLISYVSEHEELDKLNYLACLIDGMPERDLDKFIAIMGSGCSDAENLDDVINLIFNLDAYDIIPGIYDYECLGVYYANNAGIVDIPHELMDYIDYGRYGRKIAMDDGGGIFGDYYVRPTGEALTKVFDGSCENIPAKYRIFQRSVI